MSILLVDDEKEIADLVEVILKNEGYEVIKYYDSHMALREAETNPFIDLAILDVMMPGIDGFSICAKIREKYTYPIIMLTARVEEIDKITGLSIGADDYVTKPFHPLELLARVKAQLRRYKTYAAVKLPEEESYESKGLWVSRKEHAVRLYDEPINLTPTEFEILWLLCRNAGKVVSSETIFETIWQERYLDCNNTVMVHIRRLREKLKEPSRNPKIIKTIWGVGYKIEK